MVEFTVASNVPGSDKATRNHVYLVPSPWDDWFEFATVFTAYYFDSRGRRRNIGETKIGQFGLEPARANEKRRPGHRSPDLPTRFTALDERFFSLGQDTSYYTKLDELGAGFRDSYLRGIKDIAYDDSLRRRAKDERVTDISLLRSVPLRTVEGQFARLASGGALLTPYNFLFAMRSNTGYEVQLEFAVKPESRPPSNIHVLIGRNGVGKTTVLNRMVSAIMATSRQDEDAETKNGFLRQISNVVSVSFSAFDDFKPISTSRDSAFGLTCHYIGLKKDAEPGTEGIASSTTKSGADIGDEMLSATYTCLLGARRSRLQRALRLLEGDPVFATLGLVELIEDEETDIVMNEMSEIFQRLSSGHKIVLLTIARLVETVEEKSIVLLDEPEAHLHPPLLSAFVRALSDLLSNRNGMAVVATHSPVVLQEVPRSCVHVLHRSGTELTVERPSIETFGENVGTLTDEVFGLEVIATGYHKMLADIATEHPNYERALDAFDGQLGTEGRAVLRAMYATLSSRRHVGH